MSSDQTATPTVQTPLLLTALLLVDSLHFVFARALSPHLPAATGALLVLGVACVELLIFTGVRRTLSFNVLRQNLAFFAIVGVLVAVSTQVNYAAVAFIDPGTASLLGKTATVFSIALGVFWLRETYRPLEWLGAVIAIGGAILISFQPGEFLRLGSLLVLASTFMYALHAAVVKRHSARIDFENFFFWRVAATTFFLLLLVPAGGGLTMPQGRVWLIVLLAGTVDVVISRTLYYLALRELRVGIHALLLTLSPVVTIGWSLLIFRESPTLQALVGGAIVVVGILLVTRGRNS